MNDIAQVTWPAPPTPGTRHGVSYLYKAFGNPAPILQDAFRCLEGVQFDTMVCTGLSGLLVAPFLARAMGRHLLVVRKEQDTSNHSGCPCEGTMGSKWIFVDECIASGATLARVARRVRQLHDDAPRPEFVGVFLYDNAVRYADAWNARVAEWDSIDFDPDRPYTPE